MKKHLQAKMLVLQNMVQEVSQAAFLLTVFLLFKGRSLEGFVDLQMSRINIGIGTWHQSSDRS